MLLIINIKIMYSTLTAKPLIYRVLNYCLNIKQIIIVVYILINNIASINFT